jgi:poly-gamma-glutamate capsule biosynthesis protein CapA/YwtB (metallophosphatase superfamily)
MPRNREEQPQAITLFLCGDVMTGRGIDQILPHPGDPALHESYVKSARRYVELAEQANGPIPVPVAPSYVWGDALSELRRVKPDVRIVNLETSITESTDWQPKGINYKMHPRNITCLTAAGIDCCALANNHVLDWGYTGLADTLHILHGAGIKTAGAGRDLAEASRPAILDVAGKGRVLAYSYGVSTSGIPRQWAATEDGPGVNLLPNLSPRTAAGVARRVRQERRQGDVVVASIHWGDNWGYEIPHAQSEFARTLIDEAGADVVHGHSSHHAKGMEIYNGKPILYGCGDFLNDYEGIGGREEFRDDLALMYFVTLAPESGTLVRLTMTPLQIRNFRLNRPGPGDVRTLHGVLSREVQRRGAGLRMLDDDRFALQWD